MSRYGNGRLPVNRWPLWGPFVLAGLAACGGDSPAGPGRELTLGSPLYSTAPSNGTFAYVTNEFSNNVSVIRTSDNTVVATVAVGNTPVGVAVTPDGAFAYVTNAGSNNVSVIRTSDNTVVATVAVGSDPWNVAVTPDGAFVYVTNVGSSNVSVIRTSDNTVVTTFLVGSGPVGVAVTPDGAVAYVANSSPVGNVLGNVAVIRTSDNTVVARVALPCAEEDGCEPHGVAVTPDGAFVYVMNLTSNNVSVIRTSDNTVVATVAVGSSPISVAITPAPAQACTLEALVEQVNALRAAGKLRQAEGHALSVKLEAALRLLERDKPKASDNLIGAFLNQVGALVRSRRLSEADAGPLRDQAACVRTQL
jgi:YVTN family beta-propeller protein